MHEEGVGYMNSNMRRTFLRLAPVLALAIAVFVMVPAAAQAEPHFYKNGTVLKAESGKQCKEPSPCFEESPGEHAGEGLPIIAWGTLVLETKTVGTITCQNEFGGQIWNPTGGGAGETSVRAYNAYNCTNEACEAGFKAKQEIIAEGLGSNETTKEFGQWLGKLTEPVVGTFRLKIGNTVENSPTQIKFLIKCGVATEFIKVKSTGELTPKLINGTVIGSGPAKIEFGTGSGELEISKVKEGKVQESLKAFGYGAGEVIKVANP